MKEQGSSRQELGVAKTLTVGHKAGRVGWGQIAKDLECPAKALGLHPVSSKWAVNDKIYVVHSGEDEWKSGKKQGGTQGDDCSIWGERRC